MRQKLIKYIENVVPELSGRVFSFPVPQEVKYPYALLGMAKRTINNGAVSDKLPSTYVFEVMVYSDRMSTCEPLANALFEALHRPDPRSLSAEGIEGIASMRVEEMAEGIFRYENQVNDNFSSFSIKITIMEAW